MGATVAPRAGAWIETSDTQMSAGMVMSHPVRVRGLKPRSIYPSLNQLQSHPVRVRGLKLRLFRTATFERHVAPRAGAWIETFLRGLYSSIGLVAPRAGAWIETSSWAFLLISAGSHPVRVRGLKHLVKMIV